jgi:hypothetical protein
MDENDQARALEEAARSRDLREPGVPGHHWNSWRRLTGDEYYYAACSCGWRSTGTDDVSPMLRQVKEHLNAVRQSRGWPPSARAQARNESGPDPGQGEVVDLRERARGLRTAARGEQMRLSRSLSHSTDLLSASAEQADRLVTELERGQSARTGASAPSAEIVQYKVERARELRKAIAAAAAALAVITEEIAAIHLEAGREETIDYGYGERLIQPAEAEPSSGETHDK